MWRTFLLAVTVGLVAGVCVAGEAPAGGMPRLALVVDPAGLAQVVHAPGELPGILEKATQAGFSRVLAAPAPLAANAPAAKSAVGVAEVLAAASAAKLDGWCLLPLFGTLPDLAPGQCAAPRAGGEPLAGVPCYALPETRAALLAEAKRTLALPAQGVFLLLDGPVVWPKGNTAARDYGYNPPVLEEYRRRYGSDARDAKPDSLEQLFFLRLKGEHLAAAVREVAAAVHGKGRKMGLVLPLSEAGARTAVHLYVDVEGLLRDKTLDEVAVIAGQRYNFLGWKVQVNPAPVVWTWAAAAPDGTGLRSTIGMALQNTTADGLALDALAALAQDRWGEPRAAVAALAAQALEQERFAAAVAKGELAVVAGVGKAKSPDQSTTHGVAQSFRSDKTASVVGVRLFLALRAAPDAQLADLPVEIRADREGKPEGEVMATGAVNPCTLSSEPSYSWALVRFPTPLRLEAGRTYWIHLPNTPGYMWQVDKTAPYAGGNSWSRLYSDYSSIDWVFEVLAENAP
jgi:hypothetical protein